MQNLSKIALIGRANVGKSTIFNKLLRRKSAIVDKRAGITRDRKEGVVDISNTSFILIDTAGVELNENSELSKGMNEQSFGAIKEADIVLFVVDSRDFRIEEDKKIAEFIRESFKKLGCTKSVIIVANKSEALNQERYDFESLGMSDGIVYISAEHNMGFADLYTELFSHLGMLYSEEIPGGELLETTPDNQNNMDQQNLVRTEDVRKIVIAIIGRPNVGKSTLLNTIVQEQRVITSDIAGTTTDSVHVKFKYKNRDLEFIDTAGKRKPSSVSSDIERLFVKAAETAVKYSNLVILVVDSQTPVEKQDLQIADMALNEGKGVVVALNKWDLIVDSETRTNLLKEIKYRMGERLSNILKVIPISALDNFNIEKLLDEGLFVSHQWNKKIATNKLNVWLNLAVNASAPPHVGGRLPKLNFVKQVGIRPPSFAIFGTRVNLITQEYIRYLSNNLAKRFKLENIPIRIFLRQKENPYHKREGATTFSGFKRRSSHTIDKANNLTENTNKVKNYKNNTSANKSRDGFSNRSTERNKAVDNKKVKGRIRKNDEYTNVPIRARASLGDIISNADQLLKRK